MLLLFKSLFEGFEAILIAGLNLLKAVVDFLISLVSGLLKPVKAGAEKGTGCITVLVLSLVVFLGFTFRNTACTVSSCAWTSCQGIDKSWADYFNDSDDNDNDNGSDDSEDHPAFVTVSVKTANVRASTSTSSQKLCTLKKGQKLQCEDKIQVDGVTWYGVTLTGKYKEKAGQDWGWIRGDLVQESG